MDPRPSICISGMIGVGKSTLANLLAAHLHYDLVSESRIGIDYLSRLFEDPARWGLEAQIAFLVGKAEAIFKKADVGGYVLDRSLEEDATIFYRYFRDTHNLSDLSDRTYMSLYSLLSLALPAPAVWVLCDIDYDSARKRIQDRDEFSDYEEGFVQSIFTRYRGFLESKKGFPHAYICDASENDWTSPECAKQIVEDISLILKSFPNTPTSTIVLERHA